ncbi:MAG: HEPN domain-containing protein [Firmicutes bacterium]|nr:HEPN domain-containing protein [Bacillota bacterium]
MNREEKFGFWLEFAERDLDAAEAMYQTGKWFYVVFMCQQAVEKLVKGLYLLYVDENVPKIHNIGTLINRFESLLPVSISEERYVLFETLTKYYIADRYPQFVEKVDEQIAEETAKNIYFASKEVFQWLLTLRPQET